MTEHVKGKAVHIFFEAPNSFYKVLLVKIKEASFQWNEKQITVVGNFADIIEGNEYSFEGRLTKHARYGMQFQAQNFKAPIFQLLLRLRHDRNRMSRVVRILSVHRWHFPLQYRFRQI